MRGSCIRSIQKNKAEALRCQLRSTLYKSALIIVSCYSSPLFCFLLDQNFGRRMKDRNQKDRWGRRL